MQTKTDNTKYLYLGLAFIVFIVAPIIFLASHNDYGHTNLSVLQAQGSGFLIFMAVKFLIALLVGYIAYRVYEHTQEAGKTLILVVVALVIFGWAFGNGCTIAANDGVTGPGGRPLTIQK